ncbi:hypothetical protein CXT76_00935 [Candidatus Parvarchaeota archaeon]|jgi:hypothetical protein|nr:MAG: hypothetical protein CXT76_00935 [Candidatus Parvarchaeota archaeon]HIG51955.1 hypothetical protein [Candidatus Pacearchaeota archaeon]
MKLEVNIEKGPALLIIGSLLLVGGLFFVQGYNPSGLGGTPSMMGHSVDEIDWTQSLPSLIVDGGVNAFTDPGFFASSSTYGFRSYFGSMQTSSFSVSMPKIYFYGPVLDGVLTDTDVEITGNLAVTGSITSDSGTPVYEMPPGCGGGLTTASTCATLHCNYQKHYNCATPPVCVAGTSPSSCSTTPIGTLNS